MNVGLVGSLPQRKAHCCLHKGSSSRDLYLFSQPVTAILAICSCMPSLLHHSMLVIHRANCSVFSKAPCWTKLLNININELHSIVVTV